MKYKIIIICLILIVGGCSSIKILEQKDSSKETKTYENVFYENFVAKGIVKFYVEDQKISSRFNFKKNREIEEIEFIDLFNNIIVTFEINKDNIKIKDDKKNVNSQALQKIINRPIFKNIIINFSKILSGKANSPISVKKYKNGLYKSIKNNTYTVYYKIYNSDLLPVLMKIDFFNIMFDLKILNWKLIK